MKLKADFFRIYIEYSVRCRPMTFDRIGKTETSASLGENNRANYMAAVQVNPNRILKGKENKIASSTLDSHFFSKKKML